MEELSRPSGDAPFGWALALWRFMTRRRRARPARAPEQSQDMRAWPAGFLRW